MLDAARNAGVRVSSRGLGVSWAATAAAMAVGAFAALAYTLSPVTVWFLLLTPVLFWWAGRGLSPRERVWMTRLLITALAARLLTLAGFFLFSDRFRVLIIEAPGDPGAPSPYGVLFNDEWIIKQFSFVVTNMAQGFQVTSQDVRNVALNYGQSGFVYGIAFFQLLLGAAPYGVHLLNVAAFFIGAVIMYRLVRSAYGRLPALVGLAIVLFMPTLFAWSISALKEPSYFLLTAVSIAAVERCVRSPRTAVRLGAISAAVLAIAALETIRRTGVAMTAGGLTFGVLAWLATLRKSLCVVAVVMLAAGGAYSVTRPAVQQRVLTALSQAAGNHMGYVRSRGHAYKMLDSRFYSLPQYRNGAVSLQSDEAVRFVIRAAVSFVAVPLPWDARSGSMLALVPQQVLWYALVALAVVGVVAGLRRDALVTWLLVGVIVCGGGVVALTGGNIGTLVRMRDMIVPFVIWFGALGGCVVVESAVRRHSARGERQAQESFVCP